MKTASCIASIRVIGCSALTNRLCCWFNALNQQEPTSGNCAGHTTKPQMQCTDVIWEHCRNVISYTWPQIVFFPFLDEQLHRAPESAEGNCQADVRRAHLSGSDHICWGLMSIRINTGFKRKGLYCQTIRHQLNSYSNLCLPFMFFILHLEFCLNCSYA